METLIKNHTLWKYKKMDLPGPPVEASELYVLYKYRLSTVRYHTVT